MTLYDELASLFVEYGYQWSTDAGYVTPDARDIELVVDAAKTRLYDGHEGAFIETGRLIIQKKSNTNYSIYLLIGDTK